MTENNKPMKNTDTELFREVEGDHYSPSLHKTESGGIGIDIGGYVIVRSLRSWHNLDIKNKQLQSEDQRLRELLEECRDYYIPTFSPLSIKIQQELKETE